MAPTVAAFGFLLIAVVALFCRRGDSIATSRPGRPAMAMSEETKEMRPEDEFRPWRKDEYPD